MISDPKFNTAKEWFEKLRDNLVETIQNIDEKKFEISNWDHKSDGGGKMSKINHIKKGLFKNIKNNFEAARYHSLVVDRKKLSKDLIITAETKNKTIMGLMHKNYDIHGFQFHPESISTKVGMKLIGNFIKN